MPRTPSSDKLSIVTEEKRRRFLPREDQTGSQGREGGASQRVGLEDVLAEPFLRNVFHEFLRLHGQEKELAFTMEVDNTKKVLSSSSSIIMGSRSPKDLCVEASDERQKFFCNKINEILTSYLTSGASCQLKLDSDVQEEVVRDLQQIMIKPNPLENEADLHVVLASFERVQGIVFRSMIALFKEVLPLLICFVIFANIIDFQFVVTPEFTMSQALNHVHYEGVTITSSQLAEGTCW